MKTLLVGLLCLSSVSAFARETVKEALSRIETDRNVRCDYRKGSLALCMGSDPVYKICTSTSTYSCYGLESFQLKLKIKSSFNYDSQERESSVVEMRMN